MRLKQLWIACGCVALAASTFAQSTAADEEQAKRRLESGRTFARQGNYQEALTDFRAIAETHANTSVADNALLEIARYYLDIANDLANATVAVESLLKKYPLSDAAADGHIMAGRLALAKSHQPTDLENAQASFDRVRNLFPNSTAVGRSLQLSGDVFWYGKKYDEALGQLTRVEAEYSTDVAAPDAYLSAGRVWLSLGDPIAAMEDIQQVRSRFPQTPEAELALARLTLLHRLYVRVPGAPAFALTTESVGPTKLDNVIAMVRAPKGMIYYATDSAVGALTTGKAEFPSGPFKPQGLTLDATGNLTVLEQQAVRPATTPPMPFLLPKKDGNQEYLKVQTAVQLSNGDWLASDGDQKAIHKFSRAGAYVGVWAPVKVSSLAVNALDEVAGIENDPKGLVFLDATGKVMGRTPAKTTGYELKDMVSLNFDWFGHLYVLENDSIAVFSPYPSARMAGSAPAAPSTPARAGAPAGGSVNYRLLTLYTELEKAPGAFTKAKAFVIDPAGGVLLYDDKAKKVLVYR